MNDIKAKKAFLDVVRVLLRDIDPRDRIDAVYAVVKVTILEACSEEVDGGKMADIGKMSEVCDLFATLVNGIPASLVEHADKEKKREHGN